MKNKTIHDLKQKNDNKKILFLRINILKKRI